MKITKVKSKLQKDPMTCAFTVKAYASFPFLALVRMCILLQIPLSQLIFKNFTYLIIST